MKAVYTEANPSGAFPPIQEGNFARVPAGMAQWPEDLDTGPFYQYNGFVKLTFLDGRVTACEPDVEAWERWKASLPPEPEPGPEPASLEERVKALEEDNVWDQMAKAYSEGVNEA